MFVSNPISLGEEKRIAFVAGDVAGSLPPYAEMAGRKWSPDDISDSRRKLLVRLSLQFPKCDWSPYVTW